jgi:hypothetical protein
MGGSGVRGLVLPIATDSSILPPRVRYSCRLPKNHSPCNRKSVGNECDLEQADNSVQ